MPGTLTISNLPILSERYFTRQRESLVDENIYDKGSESMPFTTGTVRLVGNTTASAVVELFLNDALQGSFSADSNGDFEFSVRILKGKNRIEAKTQSDGQLIGDTLFLNAYTFNTFLQAYADGYLAGNRDDQDRLQQEKFLADGVDWDGNATEISAEAMTKNFGQYVSGKKLSAQTRVEYRDFLEHQFDSYFYAPTVRSLAEISQAYMGSDPSFRFLKDHFFARNRGATLSDSGFKLNTKLGVGNFLTLEWGTSDLWMYRRWFRILANETLLDINKQWWVYVDGDVDQHNDLTVKFMEVLVPEADFPVSAITSRSQTIPEAEIRADTTGEKTGVVNTLYVAVDRLPLSVTSISGATFGDLAAVAEIIEGTGWISLGAQKAVTDIGDVTVTYTFRLEPRILSRVTTTDHITAIEFNHRIRRRISPDGTTNGFWTFATESRVNEFIVVFPNIHLLDPSVLADFNTLCDEVIPAHKLKLVSDDQLSPSPQFPAMFSAELGATRRARTPLLGVISAELGATRRAFGGTIEGASLPKLEGELGATSREQGKFLTSCIAEWVDGSPVKLTDDGVGDALRSAIRPSDGYVFVLATDRYLYFYNGTTWSVQEDFTSSDPFNRNTADIGFQQNGDMMISHHVLGDGLYATFRPISGDPDIDIELADDTIDSPNTDGLKGVSRYLTEDFAVAYARTVAVRQRLSFKVYDVSLGLWSGEINLVSPDPGSALSSFDDTLVRQHPAELGSLRFVVGWRGEVLQNSSIYYTKWPSGTWELVYDRGLPARRTSQANMVCDKDDPEIVYAVARDGIVATESIDSEIRFFERSAGGSWTNELLSNASDQGARWPDIVQDDKGNLYVTWTEFDTSVTKRSIFARCRKAGSTEWSPIFKVADSLSAVTVGDAYPQGLTLPKKADLLSYGVIPFIFGDDFGANNAGYWRRGNRGV